MVVNLISSEEIQLKEIEEHDGENTLSNGLKLIAKSTNNSKYRSYYR